MFRKMRRPFKEISEEALQELLINSRRGVLAVNGDEGYPYAVPVNYFYDRQSGKIYFHSCMAGHKAESIKNNAKVCFTIYGNECVKDEPWAPYLQSAVIFGRCRLIESREETLLLVKKLAMKYFPSEDIADREIEADGYRVGMYEIIIEHMTGKQIQER